MPLRTFTLPSTEQDSDPMPDQRRRYHRMEDLYPHAPVPLVPDGVVLRRATLLDLTGVPTLLDWVSDGSIILVELRRLMARETEFTEAVKRLGDLIEGDMGGKMVMLTDERLLLLPPGIDTGGS